jgi:hypothetical protein
MPSRARAAALGALWFSGVLLALLGATAVADRANR